MDFGIELPAENRTMKLRVMYSILAISALGIIGLSVIGEYPCNAAPSCSATSCCPKCGCHEALIPVCHSYCTTKKETKYRYCCKCDVICIPDQSCCWTKCGVGLGEDGNRAKQGCCKNNCGCADGNCNCLIKEAYKLVKIPYTVEVPVQKCAIEWVCPKCGCNCGWTEQSNAAPATPVSPPPPAPQKSASMTPTSPAQRNDY
jgi:hypothetical protein